MDEMEIKMCLSRDELAEVRKLLILHTELKDELDAWLTHMFDAIDDGRVNRLEARDMLVAARDSIINVFMAHIPAPDDYNHGGGEDDAPCSCLEGRT